MFLWEYIQIFFSDFLLKVSPGIPKIVLEIYTEIPREMFSEILPDIKSSRNSSGSSFDSAWFLRKVFHNFPKEFFWKLFSSGVLPTYFFPKTFPNVPRDFFCLTDYSSGNSFGKHFLKFFWKYFQNYCEIFFQE